MAASRTTTVLARFVRYLERSERRPSTIKNYASDLRGFAVWFAATNDLELDPSEVTATDVREYKRHLVQKQRLKPSSVNRKLATLRTFLGWAVEVRLIRDGRAPRPSRLCEDGFSSVH